MDFTEITNLVTSVGFPVVMCLLMYKYITDDSKQTRDAITALEKAVDNLIEIIKLKYDIEHKGDK